MAGFLWRLGRGVVTFLSAAMKTIIMGESGLECSRLAYGCWRVTGVIHHPPIDEEHDKKSHESIKAAFDAGYTLFDLSDVDSDGLVEEVLGRTLKEVSRMRDRIVIATKCGIREKGAPDKDAPPPVRSFKGTHHPLLRRVAQADGSGLHRPLPVAPAGLPDGTGLDSVGI